ncbi:FAD-dependent oxidoreductase [Streptomyces venezuelae]|uniref:FAD-dependent oxidoreductase n=1 Tax=Streptomyces venezuelae TaxID=54571 RepID=UPI0037924D1E
MSQDARGVEQSGGRGHAVVIGAGLAGLTAARALANSMDHVTVIERDHLPRGAARRRGLPQARHTHSLTTAAQQGLEELFPGIGADFARAGAVRIRLPQDVLVLGPAGWLPRFDADLSMLSASRDLIDAVLRARLRAEPAVTFLTGHEVQALQPGPNDTVTGVWTRRRGTGPKGLGPRRLIPADFVVDASGHASRAPHWLAGLGYEPPRETVVPARTTYASTVFAPPLGHVADWQSLLLTAAPGHPRQGTLNVIEGGRLALTLAFADGTPPPTDHAALLHAAGLLRHPLLRDVIESATPLGPVHTCTRTENRWRHYDQLRRWPDQFLVLGDALAVTDPAHGQGMTHAVQSALVLDGMLSGHGTTVGLAYRLRRALAHRLAPAWQSSTHHLRTTGPATTPPTDTATAGLAGVPGAAGTAAAPGPAGALGSAGAAGVAGAASTAGAAGLAGDLGAAGMAAAPGVARASGLEGTTGPAGVPGAAGTAAAPGPAGALGSAGAAGMAGAASTAGTPDTADAAGALGAAGVPGPVDAVGAASTAGIPDPADAADMTGAVDPATASGTTGTAGAAAVPGAAGVSGPGVVAGVAGGPGAAGAAGTAAAPGAVGVSGPAGASGKTGTTVAATSPSPAATSPSPTAATPHPPPTPTPAPPRGLRAWFAVGPRVAGRDRPRGLRAWLARRVTARIAAEAVTEPYAAARLLVRLQAVGPLAVVPRPGARRAPAPPPVPAPPSVTHGEHARRRRAPAPAAPVIGVATGSARLYPAGSSAQWPAPAPAGERRRP